ncbi:MAG: hypothetical protein CL913_10010 [Deltaproteobacteria bacterium]|nr:hypothetical protein [Deltaproteobacteria bacterium]
MPKKEKQNQPLAKVAFRFPGSLTYMLQRSCQTQFFYSKTRKIGRKTNPTQGGQGIWRLDGLSKASVIFPSLPTSHGLVPPDRFCWQQPRWNCANRMRPIPFVRAPRKRTTEIGQQRTKVSWIQEKGQEVFRQADFRQNHFI